MIKDNYHKVYISFGSNKGNRLNYIVNSLKELEVQVGRIVRVSNLYKTKSWGFESRDFYNGCVILKTKFSPEIVLKKLISIEDVLGRTRNETDKYSSREIDLDLLFFDKLISSSKDLILPHPHLNKRNFVLIPMFDIAPEFIHPIIKKSIKSLLMISKDNSAIKKIKNNNYYIPFWERYSFISIEGNIGVGKTTLSKKIESHFDIESLNENYKLNPYLEDFYNNPNDFSFKLESFFLNERVGQINKHFLISQKRKTISDFWIGKSLVFAKNNLNKKSFEKYTEDFKNLNFRLRAPEIIIFLSQNILQLQKQIIERGRSFEKKISKDYLNSIAREYEIIFDKKHSFIFILLSPKEVLSLKNEKGLESLFRKVINT